MNLFVLGINHKTAPIEIREQLCFKMQEVSRANALLKERVCLKEGSILSTCNRVEIYAVTNRQKDDYINRSQCFLSESRNIHISAFKDRFYVYKDEQAAGHLLRVASGLDSMVIGEAEILGQVKQAYRDARESKTAGRVLNRLFQQALNTAKKVRSDTLIARGPVSVSSVAVRLAKERLGSLKDKRVLIIGTGKIGQQTALGLKKSGIKSILLSNRTFAKARRLADNFGTNVVRFENFRDGLKDADIIITSTGAPHLIIRRQDILSALSRRDARPLFIVDLAVPRDVQAGLGGINNIHLYDIDDLQEIADKNLALRKNELGSCQRIIAEGCRKFSAWLNSERTKNEK